jgi:hypothetical protein
MFLVRPASIASICSCMVSPVHSDTLPSDRVLVPLATPSTSTLNGTTPPFLLHITSQLLVGSTLSSSVFETGVAMTVPCAFRIVLDANRPTPRMPLKWPWYQDGLVAVRMRCWLTDVLAYLVTEQMVKVIGTLLSAKYTWSVTVPRRYGIVLGEPRLNGSGPVCMLMPARLPVAFVFLLLPLVSARICVWAFQFSAL